MDWESVLDHVERRRQLDLSPDEEKVFDKAENNKESARKEKENHQKTKHLNHSDSMETQVTRYGRENRASQLTKNTKIQTFKNTKLLTYRLSEDNSDGSTTDPFSVMGK